LKNNFSQSPVILQLPLYRDNQFCGVIDLLTRKAYVFSADGSGKMTEEPIPPDRQGEVDEYFKQLVEVVAESDDALLEQYLEKGNLEEDALKTGLRNGTLAQKLAPVVCGSALRNMGIFLLLDVIVNFLPSPKDRPMPQGVNSQGSPVERPPDDNAPLSALVFKTIADPFAGKLSLFRVYSGTLSSDSNCYNKTQETRERIGQIYGILGKNQKPVESVSAGDFGAVAKLKATTTGDTLCDEKAPVKYPPLKFPEPVISFAIAPKTRGDEEKLSNALARLMEEDPTLRTKRDPQTKELILSGMGQVHIEVILERLKRKFGVEVEMKTPKVPYKETIRGRSKAQGKYKKQTGGRGQYGDAWIEVEPLPRGGGFEFVDKIVGGAIPRQYIPAVEKGIVEAKDQGILAGYPVVDFRVTLYDGSYHEVDSSEMAFKIAGSLGFKKGMMEANPVLLEPIMSLEVIVPDDSMGDIIGDLNSKRGRVLGVTPLANQHQSIKAQAPMAEVLQYASDLRSMTGGRGDFTMEFSHYEEVPPHMAEKIIAEAKREAEKE
ncbi:MAG: elongation factor G, partial [Candidatus Tectomicrobia bacterium]|nr:elongation factor G [Candidatus Tectomicrobia bacterium]